MGISPAQLITILSASIAPVIMISGVGLLLLSMTNRYSRVIDRARDLVKRLDSGDSKQAALMLEELRITYRRGRILRLAILLSSFSILFVAVRVLSLFAEQVLGVGVDYFSVPCFGLALLALLASLYLFIRDLGVSLGRTGARDRPLPQAPQQQVSPRIQALLRIWNCCSKAKMIGGIKKIDRSCAFGTDISL